MPQPSPKRRLLLVLFFAAVVAGIFARVAHLDRKLFFEDETITDVRSSGHTMEQVIRLFDDRVHPVSEIRAYLDRDPATGIGTVLSTLEHEDPHHAPLFYVVERLALDTLGASSATTFRLPSVLFGIAAIAFAFAFGTALYRSRLGGGILASLVAVSPIHIVYARQAREYALFSCLVFASSFFLLRALEGKTWRSWIAYAIAVMLGIYTDPIFCTVLAAHAVYVAIVARRNLRTIGAYAAATALGLATFAPWALNALHSSGSVEDQLAWGANAYPVKLFAQKWAFNVGAVFFDAEFSNQRLTFVALIALVIVLVSLVLVVRGSDGAGGRARAIALPLAAIPALPFVFFDLAHGGHFSTIPRYLMASWIGVETIVASALVAGLTKRARYALGTFAFLVVAGTYGAIADNRFENWWDNNNNVAFQDVARTIDATSKPLIVMEPFYENSLLIARYLNPDASFLLLRDSTVPVLPASTHQVFAFIPTPEFLRALQAREKAAYTIENVSPPPPSVIASFHHALKNDKTFTAARNVPGLAPDDALWSFVRR